MVAHGGACLLRQCFSKLLVANGSDFGFEIFRFYGSGPFGSTSNATSLK